MAIKPVEIIIKAKEEASGVFDSLKSKVAAVGVAIAGYFGIKAFVGAVEGAANLEEAMSRVEAATNASAEDLALLRKAAEDAGASTKFSSTQAAGALEELGKAGLTASEAIGALPAVLNLAQAGNIELGRASEVVTAAVMGMGLKFSDAGRVADVLAMGANATKTSVEGLAQALSYAAPVANSLGLSLETTTAIIGQFAQGGIDASRAGTALNSILSQFGDPASKFREELATAGIVTNDFEKALHDLAAAGPRGAKAINAVGQEAGPALRAMLNRGMGALDELNLKLKDASGSAAATGATMQNNLNGAISGLGSVWDTIKIKLATPVLPVLKNGVEQLTGALRTAVSDGTIGKFGDAIATAFSSGIKWARDFLSAIDFNKLGADLRAFADRSGEVFKEVGEYATSAGATAQTAYGVMSAGANGVLAAIYKIGEVFADMAGEIQGGVANILDGLAKITFGGVSASFKAAASDMRISAEATLAAGKDLGDKSADAFNRMAEGAQTARNGWSALTKAVADTKPAADTSSAAIAQMAAQIEAAGQKSAEAAKATDAARKVTEDKRAADTAATVALQQLREEYTRLVAGGSLQAAAEKLQEINKALQGTPVVAKDAAKAAAEAALKVETAFSQLGITSNAKLKEMATEAKGNFETIKNSGTASALDIQNAFTVMAQKTLDASGPVGSIGRAAEETALKAKAAAAGLTVEFDQAGKAIVTSMTEGSNAVDATTKAVGRTTEQLKAQVDAWDTLMMKYKLSADYNENQIALLEKQNALLERAAELERKRLNIDKEGFSTDSSGNRIAMGGDLTSLTGIASFLKAAGVDDDAVARNIAKKFANQQGQVLYAGSSGQREYGGAGSTLSQALLKAAESYTFADKNSATSTIPKPTQQVITQNHNITLNGRNFGAVPTNEVGADVLSKLLAALTEASSRS